MFAVVALTILTASPEAHAWVHEPARNEAQASRCPAQHADHADHSDPGQGDHACAVTLAQQGFCDTTPEWVGGTTPDQLGEQISVSRSAVRWTAPDHWLHPAQAPPVR